MRRLGIVVAAALAIAAAAPRDWARVVVATPAGGVATGNPAARVHLVEYGSFTCSHCAAFASESRAGLARYVASGSTQVEFRNLLRDQIDLAAALIAHCGGPQRFRVVGAAIFAQQPQWLPRAFDYQDANQARFALYPPLARVKALADGSGLTAIGVAAGTPAAALDKCLADQKLADRLTATTAQAPASVTATPGFLINGKPAPLVGWAGLDPLLRAAGAR